MVKFDIQDNVLMGTVLEKDDTQIIVPDTVTSVKECRFKKTDCWPGFYYSSQRTPYNEKKYEFFLPDSVNYYYPKCFDNVYYYHLNIPYRKTLELGVTIHTFTDILTLRLEDGINLKFGLFQLKTKPVTLALQAFRTEDMRMRCSVSIRGPIAVYLAIKDKNEEAVSYIKQNATSIAKNCIDIEDYEGLERLFSLNLIGKVQAENILKYAQDSENAEALVMATQYKHAHFSPNEKNKRFRL